MKFDKDFLKLRKVKIGSNKYEYDLIYCGMNINGVDQYGRLKCIDKDGNIHSQEGLWGFDQVKILISAKLYSLMPWK